jgi:hypothetical protein
MHELMLLFALGIVTSENWRTATCERRPVSNESRRISL